MKGYDKFSFNERKKYEETFVLQNSKLIQDITGASNVFNISQSPLDKRSGIDAILQVDSGLSIVALRIRKPQYKEYAKRFTTGHHISQSNSQIHTILNSVENDLVYYPHFILQINGVEEKGYCSECWAIKIQTNVFAKILFKYWQDNTLDDFYKRHLDAYEWHFKHPFKTTHTGVDVYYIENNEIKYQYNNAKSKD